MRLRGLTPTKPHPQDFGESIPGHGGLTDRFDCMCLMGIFSYLYLVNVVEPPHVRLSHALQKALALSEEDQLALFTRMGYLLAGKALLPKATVALLGRIPGAGGAGGA